MSVDQAEATASEAVQPDQHPIPKGRAFFSTIGPGLVLAMTFLGTGDLVQSSASGANYGYALVWTVIISIFARIFIISTIAKYTLMNRHGDTQILQGFGRVAKWLPGAMSVVVLIAGFVTQATFLKAGAVGLYNTFGGKFLGDWGVFVAGIIIVVATYFIITSKSHFKIFEHIARICSILLILIYVYAIIRIGTFDLSAFFKGMAFQMPTGQVGTFAPIVLIVATIGTIAGNMPNLLYSGFMKDKGWLGPKFRKIQQLDLWVGMLPLIIINMLFWIVAAEYSASHPGFMITSEQDLSTLMYDIVGPAGPIVFWLTIFSIGLHSFPPESRGFAQLASNGIHLSTKLGAKWAGRDEESPIFKWIQLGVFTLLPLVACLPAAPNLVSLSIVGTALSTLLALPAIVIVLLLLTKSRKHMYTYAVNKPWETGLLAILGAIAIYMGATVAMNLPQSFIAAFGG